MKLSYDLYYLRNANLMLDLLILLKTVRLVLQARGAIPSSPPSSLSSPSQSAPPSSSDAGLS